MILIADRKVVQPVIHRIKRGDAMAVIKDYFSETGCHIIIHDDCIVKTQEEVDRIIDNVSQIIVNELLRQRSEGGGS